MLGEDEDKEVVHYRIWLGYFNSDGEVIYCFCTHHAGNIRTEVRFFVLAVDDAIKGVRDIGCGKRHTVTPLHARAQVVRPELTVGRLLPRLCQTWDDREIVGRVLGQSWVLERESLICERGQPGERVCGVYVFANSDG